MTTTNRELTPLRDMLAGILPAGENGAPVEDRREVCGGYDDRGCADKLPGATYRYGRTFSQWRTAGGAWRPAHCEACEARIIVERDAERAARDRAELVAAKLAALNIPARYRGATLDNFDLSHVSGADLALLERKVRMARRYVQLWPRRAADRFPHLVVFRGAPGTGKNRLAWSIARAIVEAEPTQNVEVVKFPVFIDQVRTTWSRGRGEASKAAIVAPYLGADLLIVDEISRHAFYGEPTQHLYDLVDPRVEEYQPTILLTNETDGGFEALVGAALASRCAGDARTWDFGSVDYRTLVGDWTEGDL